MEKGKLQEYWKINLRYLIGLLVVWFVVSFGFGILLVDQLNAIHVGGFKLGFWFAQQGSNLHLRGSDFRLCRTDEPAGKKFDVRED